MNKTVYEQRIEKGRIRLAEELLEERFGPVAAEVKSHLEQLSAQELRRLVFRIPTAASLAELGLPAVLSQNGNAVNEA